MKDDAAHELRKTDADRAADLSWDEAMRLAAVDRDQLAERLNPRRKLRWYPEYHPHTLRRYGWKLKETVGGASVVIASGRTFTRVGRDRAWYRAYLKALNS